jgi:hypothetical protein
MRKKAAPACAGAALMNFMRRTASADLQEKA